jgi:N-carbamoyl-L-amino-acid hydrolase
MAGVHRPVPSGAGGPPRISRDRLLGDLATLASIGGRPDGGVDRVAGSPADQEARRWLRTRMGEAGLDAGIDADGNVLGRLPGSTGPWLLLGSHTDTVPAGGRLDGAYGAIAALEVLRTLADAGHPLASSLEVVSFHDEEGVHSGGLTGSRALAAGAHAEHLLGYLELHIEQGPVLETGGLALGVVEGIVGIDRWDVRVLGEPNHAGTTPMAMRRDAGRVAARVVGELRELLAAVDPEMVGNAGELHLLPGAPNVVPGEARLTIELRSLRSSVLDRAADALRHRLREVARDEGCTVEMARRSALEPAPLTPAVVGALDRVCERLGRPWRRLVSGAGHDAMAMAGRVPAGMLFVPSRGGVSHAPNEHTDDDLLVLGAQALLEGALETAAALLEVPASLERLNALSEEAATAELLGACASGRWAAAVVAGRPYPTLHALFTAAEAAWWALEEPDWREAFAAHPRIGERERADATERREQAGVASADAATLAQLAAANRRYEERFGHVFLVCASGRTAEAMLADLRRRLVNEPNAELLVAAGEQAKITRLRLEALAG